MRPGYPTVRELVEWNGQEVFNHVSWHLLAQGQRCTKGATRVCFFRNALGQECAVGAVIPEALYHPAMEGKNVAALMLLLTERPFDSGGYEVLRMFLCAHATLLMRLMQVHDEVTPVMWPEALVDVAESMRLDTTVIGAFVFESMRDGLPERFTGARHVIT
ncbi:hypothetical protein [Paraburkholderia adhaesiva]|uniref:hypothetical protein n=1 Tax=Paraburkholderia adhaesiva TaxID=2883244 RepID=UPI001F2CE3E8|nr:hypothetical protein [Paraburkholderia adhaesiva]